MVAELEPGALRGREGLELAVEAANTARQERSRCKAGLPSLCRARASW